MEKLNNLKQEEERRKSIRARKKLFHLIGERGTANQSGGKEMF